MSRFEKFFSPASVAVIGASQDLTSISGQPIAHLLSKGYRGQILPVNPRYAEVAGIACHPDVASLPLVPDVAIVAVAARRVPEALTELGRKGCRFAVVLSSGFAEAGEEGALAQRRLAEIAREHDIEVIGPNCQGFMNISDGLHVGFGAPYGMTYKAGGLSLTSQSGAFGNSIVMLASAEGVGFRHYVSTGNESVTTSLDFMESMIEDPQTRVIAGYVEGFKDAHRLMDIACRARDAGKPILVWKVGTSEVGARAAASHTANLGGAMGLYRAAFRQSGIIEVDDIGDLADCAKALLPGILPRGNRLAVLTISGGAGIAMADKAALGGLTLPPLADDTVKALREVLPSFAAVANPLDVTAALFNTPNLLRVALERLARDPNIDMIGLALAAAGGRLAVELAEEIVRVQHETGIPVFVAWNAEARANEAAYGVLDAAGIPRYASPVRCARGLGALWSFAHARQRAFRVRGEQAMALHRPHWHHVLAEHDGSDLNEAESKQLLASYGIPVTRERLARDPDEAVSAAREIGLPVVMKVQSSHIPHKTEANAVRVGLGDETSVRAAFAEIVANAGAYAPRALIEGVTVQEMVTGGVELILGVQVDPLFGPAIMVGLGGVFAEVLQDVSFRLAPVTRSEAEDMLRELRGFPLLDGARGLAKADLAATIDAIERLSALAMDLRGVISELDVNPLKVLPAGQGVCALDGLVRLVGQ